MAYVFYVGTMIANTGAVAAWHAPNISTYHLMAANLVWPNQLLTEYGGGCVALPHAVAIYISGTSVRRQDTCAVIPLL